MLELLNRLAGKPIAECTNAEIYAALQALVKEKAQNRPVCQGDRRLYYISAEFLLGKLMSNNLINLGLREEVAAALASAGKSLAEVEECECEPSLGNGGLGRLAACFLDSIATLGLPGDGVGLNYHFGLFRQRFEEEKQCEYPNPWMDGASWLEDTGVSFAVPFDGFTLTSRMYDIAIVGYGAGANRLHLFDLTTVDESIVQNGIDFDKRDIAHNLTLFLYPDDSDRAGQLLRIYQQYFMVSNAAQLILKETRERGFALKDLHKHVAIQINDTHPSLVIPELIRLLTAEGIPWMKPSASSRKPALTRTTPSWPKPWKPGPWTICKKWCRTWCPSSNCWTRARRRRIPIRAWQSSMRKIACIWRTWISTMASA